MNLKIKVILASLLISGSLYATDPVITIVTSFSKTGGIYGDGKLSVVGGKVNGVDICPSANTNSNTVPGCDMEQDPGYSDNGTTDPHDDKYTGDLIIRTNDIFEMNVAWNGTGVDNPITLSSTLPSFDGKNYLRWEPLPSSCKAGSSISADGLTLTCVRTNDAHISYSEDSPFYVKVKGNTPNDIKTGPISFTISTDGLESKSDDTDGYGLTVTASPKWNIEKKYVTYYANKRNDIDGYIIRYAYLLEADEVKGEEDTTSAVMGNEALGKNITLDFTDDVSKISPNAELVSCAVSGASTSYEPYPWYNSSHPERSVGSLKEDLNVTCSQSGGKGTEVSVVYSGIDASLEHVATKTGSGRNLPATRLALASGVINIFIPLTDINTTDNAKSNDTYQLTTTNTITSFDPDSISGQSNFGDKTESIKDNSVNLTLTYRGPGYTGGSFGKYFMRNINHVTPLETTTGGWYSADGMVTPDREFAARIHVSNSGNKDFNNTIICDVMDSNTYDVIDLDGKEGVSAFKPYWNSNELNYTVEYATGYVGTWPPPLTENNAQKVITECSDSSVVWHSNTADARAVGPITKVRLVSDKGLPAHKTLGGFIRLKVRGKDLSGANLPNGTNLVNYSAVHDTVLYASKTDNWYGSYRILNEYPTPAGGGSRADRAVLTRAIVRTSKTLSMTTVEPKDEIEVTIHSTFTTDSENGETDTVKITEMLDPGLSYIMGSGNIGDPAFGTCSDLEDADPLKNICTDKHQILIWNLGQKTANQNIEDIKYKFIVGAITAKGVNHTYTIISSPTDSSVVNIRKANKNVNISIPASLFISKEVNTPFREIDQSPIEYTSYARNGSSKDLTSVDIIDILPFNGDGSDGFTFTVGSTAVEKRREPLTSFNGTLEFLEATGGYACENGVTWYFTNRTPKLLDIAPTAASNKSDGDTSWCEGTSTGPNSSCGFDNGEVTAVRLTGPALDADATCAFNIKLKPLNNKKGDIYTNTASAFAQGVTLPTLSNDVSAVVPSTLLGDFVWIDSNANGIQDVGELGASGISMELLDSSDGVINTTTTDSNGRYIFEDLTEDTAYKVKAIIPDYYSFSKKSQGTNSKKDSDVDTSTGVTDVKRLNLNQQYKELDIGLTSSLTVSGKVYKKEDNSSIAKVTVKLYKDVNGDSKLDENDTLVTTLESDENGEYTFTNIFDGNYTVVVDKGDSDIPTGYVLADKEVLALTIEKKSISDKDFPFIPPNIAPTSDDKKHDAVMNTSGAITLKDLTGADEDGSVVNFIIKSIPTDAQGVLYMSDGTTAIKAGKILTPAEAKGLKFDPKEGFVGDVEFKYFSKDNDGAVDETPATVTVPVIGVIVLSGTLYADGNGDKNINGTPISKAGESPIYVSLLSDSGTALASTLLDDKGAYSFNDKNGVSPDTNYTILITTQESGTTPSLPKDWNNADGENINSKTPTGNDGQTNGAGDGKIKVEVKSLSIPKIDFGINSRPIANDKNESTQANPGKDNRVEVPLLSISDNEDKRPSTIKVTSLPKNGTLYYNGVSVNEDEAILSFDSKKFMVDPNNGDLNVTFKYTTTDNAGVVSKEATVIMPFTDIAISGNLFDDGNKNGKVDGNLTAKADDTQLYVTLVDDKGKAVASKVLTTEGTYGFSNEDGVQPNTAYTIVLSDKEGGTTPHLPESWNNADGEKIGLTGVDGNADGIITVSVGTTNISEINFGINKKPKGVTKTQEEKFNPGTDVKIDVPMLEISDKEDVIPSIITITKLPTNGKLYYDGKLVEQNVAIKDANASKFSIDPNSGDQVVVFEYTATDRVGVSSEKATITMPFKALEIKGNVFNDGDGNGKVNGTAISAPNGEQLYATLVNADGKAMATMPINGDGTYGFSENNGIVAEHNYRIVLSKEKNGTTPSLPLNWNNKDGEHIGTGDGLDDEANGMIDVSVKQESVVEVNFGINKKPVAGDNESELQLNPGTDKQVDVPDLNVTDSEDGKPAKVTIITVPINGKLYYKGALVKAGEIIENLDNSELKLDPDNGDQSVSFTYKTTDAGDVDSEVATISMSFKGLKISGNIFDDGNNDERVNGKKISLADSTKLYVTLLDSEGKVMASRVIDSEGTYKFNGVDGIAPHSEYNIVLTKELNGTKASLPTNWNNADGESIGGADKLLDDSVDGTIAVSVVEEDVVDVNFGINKKPMVENLNVPSQLNPKDGKQIVIPTLKAVDNEDGILTTITIETVPSEGTLYYDGKKVTKGQTIKGFNPKKFTVDPDAGTPVVEFSYSTVDKTGMKSDIAKVTMPFRGVSISGNLFNDGVKDGIINGTKVSKAGETTLYVTLISSEGTALASKKLNENGGYSFDSSNGIEVDSKYKIVLSSNENSEESELPKDWSFVDSKGILEVEVKEKNIENLNFGINHKPMIKDIESQPQTTPKGDKRVLVPLLNITDNEDGTPTTVTIKTVPTEGTLYYDGKEVIEGQVIPNYDKHKLEVDPNDGTVTVEFTYTTTDSADVESDEASVKMLFKEEKVVIVPTPTPPVKVIPTPTPTVAPSATPTPVVTPTPVPNIAPVAHNVESPMVDNPGGDIRVPVVDLNVTDKDGATPTTITITTLPTGGTLYYVGEEVTQMQEIKEFDNAKFEVDPDDGAQTIVFNYTTTDNQGLVSDPARVRMPFSAVDAKENFNISDDRVVANTEGPKTVINVLGNDEIELGSTIYLLNNSNGSTLWNGGTAVAGATVSTTNSLLVPGEGTWDVVDGKIVFTAEDGFTGTPTPVYYMVKDLHGNQSNVAQVSLVTPCVCKTYKSKSVPTLGKAWIIFMMLFTSMLAMILFREENKVSL